MACAPNQNKFIVPKTEFNFGGVEYVNWIDFYMDPVYMNETYQSCIEVIHPASGKLAMDVACGYYEAAKCNPDRWFEYMGSPELNPLTPFKLNYIVSDDPEKRFTAPTLPCNEAYENDYPCSCVDCSETCPDGLEPADEEDTFTIGDLNGAAFLSALIVGTIGVIAVGFAAVFSRRSTFMEFPKWMGGTGSINRILTKFFTWWGQSIKISVLKWVSTLFNTTSLYRMR